MGKELSNILPKSSHARKKPPPPPPSPVFPSLVLSQQKPGHQTPLLQFKQQQRTEITMHEKTTTNKQSVYSLKIKTALHSANKSQGFRNLRQNSQNNQREKKNPKQLTAAVLKKKVKTHKRLNRTPFNLTKQHRMHAFVGIIFFKATNNAMSRSHPSGSTNWQQLSGSFLYCSWLSRR